MEFIVFKIKFRYLTCEVYRITELSFLIVVFTYNFYFSILKKLMAKVSDVKNLNSIFKKNLLR